MDVKYVPTSPCPRDCAGIRQRSTLAATGDSGIYLTNPIHANRMSPEPGT